MLRKMLRRYYTSSIGITVLAVAQRRFECCLDFCTNLRQLDLKTVCCVIINVTFQVCLREGSVHRIVFVLSLIITLMVVTLKTKAFRRHIVRSELGRNDQISLIVKQYIVISTVTLIEFVVLKRVS